MIDACSSSGIDSSLLFLNVDMHFVEIGRVLVDVMGKMSFVVVS